MRAVAYSRYGGPDVVVVTEVPTPEPAADEVLVRVRAASVGSADGAARRGTPRVVRLFSGLFRPRVPVLGSDFAGDVVAVGADVTRFAVGDRVVGASGSVGSAGVQLAKHFGAHVAAVTSGPNLELVKGLGADEVIDYRVTDFTGADTEYDIVFDAIGKSTYGASRRALTSHGVYLSTVPSAFLRSLFSRRSTVLFTGLRSRADIAPDVSELVRLAAAGAIDPLIDSRYSLDEAAAAHARVDSERKRGTVILGP